MSMLSTQLVDVFIAKEQIEHAEEKEEVVAVDETLSVSHTVNMFK